MIDQLQYHYDLPPYAATPEAAHAALASLLEASACQALLITSQDEFLTEYLPHRDNQRYALSAFDGSAGSGIFLRAAIAHRLNRPQFVLFVDGRYHL